MFSISGAKVRTWGMILTVLIAAIVFTHCNFGIPNFTVIVQIENGVEGTPQAGQYDYADLSNITYEYTPVNPAHVVEVYVNDTRYAASGTITVFNTYTITARLVDIRGNWSISMTLSGSASADFEFTVTISGPDISGGTFTDSRGYNGTWTAANEVVTLTYTDWNGFVLIGDHFNMSGAFQSGNDIGTWTANKTN